MIPSVALAYSVYALFLICVALFAHHDISSAVFHDGPTLLALFLFAPLVAGWAVVVGIGRVGEGIGSSRCSTARHAGKLSHDRRHRFADHWCHPSDVSSAIEFGVGLLLVDLLALRLVSRMFDRERLVTGTRASSTTWHASVSPHLAEARQAPSQPQNLARNPTENPHTSDCDFKT